MKLLLILPLVLAVQACGITPEQIAALRAPSATPEPANKTRTTDASLCQTEGSGWSSADGGCQIDHITTAPFGAPMNQSDAITHCAALRQGGFNNWTLPSHEQVEDLMSNNPQMYMDLAGMDFSTFQGFWIQSDPLYVNPSMNPYNATNSDGSPGLYDTALKTLHVLCVR